MIGLVLLALGQFPMDVFENPNAFKQLEQRGGITLSQREVKGSAYFEFRAEAQSPNTPAELCAAIFEWGTKEADGPAIAQNKVLQDGENVRVVYQQISQPVVSKRDYAMTVARESLDAGRCRIRFRITNDKAPPMPEGFVRLDKLWGEWLAEPLPEGGARLTHTMFSEPNGSVPAFLVHGAQRSATRDSALTALEKTKRFAQKGKGK